MNRYIAGVACAALLAVPAQAAPLRWEAAPQDGVTAVQWLGHPKLTRQSRLGKVAVVPRGMERGRLAFDIEVHNLSDRAAFFGQESVEVHAATETLELAAPQRAERVAGNKAKWVRIGVAVALVALIGVAAMARSPRTASRDPLFIAPPLRRAAAPPAPVAPPLSAGALPPSTSVPSRHLYTGRIFVDRPKKGLRNQDLTLKVRFNGESYPFAFRVSDAG